MKSRWKSLILRYGLAILVLAVILVVQNLLLAYSIKLSFTIPIIVGLVAVGWYGGRGPGILLSALIQAINIYSNTRPPTVSDGEWVFANFSNFALLVFIAIVMSERRSVESRLLDAGRRYEQLFQNSPFPMWIYDLETLRFLAVNRAA